MNLSVTRRRIEFFVFRRRFEFEQFCEQCAAESLFLSLEDAVRFSALTMREIARRADAGDVHFLESLAGHLVICQSSLPQRAETERRSVSSFENFLKSGVTENVEQ